MSGQPSPPPLPRGLWIAPLAILAVVALSSALQPPLPPPPGPWPGAYVAVLVLAAGGAVALVAAFGAQGVRIGRLLFDLYSGAIDDRVPGDAHFVWLNVPELLNLFLLFVYAAGALQLVLLLASALTAYDGIVLALDAVSANPVARVWYTAHLAVYLGLTLGFGVGATSYALRGFWAELLTEVLGIVQYLFNALLVSGMVTVLAARRDRERAGRPLAPAVPVGSVDAALRPGWPATRRTPGATSRALRFVDESL